MPSAVQQTTDRQAQLATLQQQLAQAEAAVVAADALFNNGLALGNQDGDGGSNQAMFTFIMEEARRDLKAKRRVRDARKAQLEAFLQEEAGVDSAN